MKHCKRVSNSGEHDLLNETPGEDSAKYALQHPPKSEALANAHLIAAAPDLLAACKSMLTIAYSRKVSEVQAACAQCEIAIARAEGKEVS